MPKNFSWSTFDVTNKLPDSWQDDIRAVAAEADFRKFPRTPFLSREAADVTHITRGRVHAHPGAAEDCPGCTSCTATTSLSWPSKPTVSPSRRPWTIGTASS